MIQDEDSRWKNLRNERQHQHRKQFDASESHSVQNVTMGEADTEIYVLHTLSRLVENVWSVVSAYMPHSEVQSHLQGASFTPP